MIESITKRVEQQFVKAIVCDLCDKRYDDDLELQEFHHIRFAGGYSSVFGDMTSVEADLCQHCLFILIKDFYRVKE